MTAISEHSYGVHAVAFSPDSQYLASLGNPKDGFLYIWAINGRDGSATLHSSNKCTSEIRYMAWMGNTLVTVGKRYVKVWRLHDHKRRNSISGRPVGDFATNFMSPKPKTLPGNKCLLGPRLEDTFTTVTPVSHHQAIVCSEKGDVCLLDGSDGTQKFDPVANVGFSISVATIDSNGTFFVSGSCGQFRRFITRELTSAEGPVSSLASPDRNARLTDNEARLTAIAPLGKHFVVVDTKRTIQVLDLENEQATPPLQPLHELPSHHSAIQGVMPMNSPNDHDASLFTWSADGLVLFWDFDGVCKKGIKIPLEQLGQRGDDYDINELKTARVITTRNVIIAGDKYGVLRYACSGWSVLQLLT